MRVYVEGDNDFVWAKVSNTGTWGDGENWVEFHLYMPDGRLMGVPEEDPFRGDATEFGLKGNNRYCKGVYVNLAGDSLSHLVPPDDWFKG